MHKVRPQPTPVVRTPHEGLCPNLVHTGHFVLDQGQSCDEALAVVLLGQAILLIDEGEAGDREAEWCVSLALRHVVVIGRN